MDKLLRQLLRGELPSAQLPATLELGSLRQDLDRLWDLTVEGDCEWGACIVLSGDQLRRGHPPVRGDKFYVIPECRVDQHDFYVGFVHTHRLDAESGGPLLGFSIMDFRCTLYDGDNLSLVRSGEELYALVRTTDCTMPPGTHLPLHERWEWQQRYEEAIALARSERAEKSESDALQRRLWMVNRALCEHLGFAFYRGRQASPLNLIYRPLPEGRENHE